MMEYALLLAKAVCIYLVIGFVLGLIFNPPTWWFYMFNNFRDDLREAVRNIVDGISFIIITSALNVVIIPIGIAINVWSWLKEKKEFKGS